MAFSTPAPDPADVNAGAGDLSPQQLLEQLRDDRLWLLRQLDAGSWPAYRLDLAALERELGQLLDQAQDRLAG
ncbi:MAG: hypothetical protein FJ050_05540 [Cyanobacteria bacterium M_surface_7_m2_040]|nr:hypothetical protein [Cyanobacteria bacterium K_Offshore_0m_m2_072]MBM5827505.1 hypothetical protein [Cyanobacteria bacterium M_surface_7_m2_040]